MSPDILTELYRRRQLWRGSRASGPPRGIETGFAALDAMLPQRGWPRGAVIEVSVPEWGIGELSLFLPLMAAYHRRGHYVTWIAPPYTPYAPALAAAGLDPGFCRVLLNPDTDRQIPWCAEKLLQSGTAGLVLAWPRSLAGQSVRRLQLAAENSEAICVFWRQEETATEPVRVWDGRPATLRLRLSRQRAGMKVEMIKARGTSHQASLVVEV